MAALALLADGVIDYRALCEVRRKNVVAQNVLDHSVGVMKRLDFAPLRLEHGKMVIAAQLEGAVLQFFVNVVQIAEHSVLEPYKRFFVTLGKPPAHVRLIQRFIGENLFEFLVYHKHFQGAKIYSAIIY